MSRLSSVHGKKWFLGLFLLAMLFLTSQVFAKQSDVQTATAFVTTGLLNVRSGPGVEYGVVTTVSGGSTVTLLGRNEDSSWVYIETAAAVKGWVSSNPAYITPNVPINSLDVVTDGTTTPAPTATATNTPTPTTTTTTTTPAPTSTSTPTPTATAVSGAAATVVTGALNVRSGPSLAYGPVAVINQGTVVSLIGRNADSSWAKIRLSNGTEGWVNADGAYIAPNVSISSLPVVDSATAPSSSATALVSTGALNVRSGPAVTYSVLTVTSQGQTVILLGRNANSSWAKIRLGNGTEGWVNASLITPSVSISSLPVADSPAAPEPPVPVAPGAVLSLRSGPGSNYPVTGSVYQGLQVNAVGRNANSTWIKVQLSDGQQGWIGAQYVQLTIPVGNLPVMDGSTPTTGTTATPVANAATVSTGAANVRSGPGIGYGIVAVANQGQTVSMLARNNLSSWVKIQLSNGTQGWINAELLTSSVAVSSLPVENVQTLSASGLVTTAALNVRTGPGVTYGVTAVVYQDQGVALLGRNADTSWLKVRLSEGTVGWVNAAYIDTATPLNSLPVTI